MRVVVVWSLLALFLAGLSGHGAGAVSLDVRVVAAVVYGVVVGVGVSSATLLGALRAGHIEVADDAPVAWGLWKSAVVPVVVAVVVAVVASVFASRHTVAGALWFASTCAVLAARLVVRPPRAVRPLVRGRFRWVIAEGAVPAACLSCAFGVVVGAVRYVHVDAVTGVELARSLGGTVVGFLGLSFGASVKTATEARRGVVRCTEAPFALPAPMLPGMALACAVLFVGPFVLPTLAGVTVIGVKAVVGVIVGGALTACGAAAGHARGVRPRE